MIMVAKQKILIVDDDANIAELISLYLTKECFETMMVHDGEEALSVFDSFGPNLILLDLMLPGIDGYQVCREIRAKSATPIIMLSAKGEVFDKVLGLELGADDYIIKPFDSKELVARVKAVLRRYQPARPTTRFSTRVCLWICRPRSWSFSTFWPPRPTRYLPGNSFLITSGVMNISAIHVP